jgi:predicted nucleic acid-binding protein
MKVVITDVSALFDIYALKILPEFFALKYEFCITDAVFYEITKKDQLIEFEIFERTQKLKVIKFTEEEETEIGLFNWKYTNRSMKDKSILWKAMQLQSMVLTCDNTIKKEAEYRNLEVHGSIWVVVELEKNKIVSTKSAIELLEQLKIVGDRLPIEKINKIIKRLKLKMD